MLVRWSLTVCSLSHRRFPIALLERPSVSALRTSSSRSVSSTRPASALTSTGCCIGRKWVGSLRDEGRGPSAERCIDQLRLFMSREDHNLRGAFRRTQRADDVEPVELGKIEVQEDEIRLNPLDKPGDL